MFGQIASVTNPASKANAEALITGIRVYFAQVNAKGGIRGRQLKLKLLDDGLQATRMAELTGTTVLQVWVFIPYPVGFRVENSPSRPIDRSTMMLNHIAPPGLLRRLAVLQRSDRPKRLAQTFGKKKRKPTDSHKSSVHLQLSVLENQIDKHRMVRRVVLSTR